MRTKNLVLIIMFLLSYVSFLQGQNTYHLSGHCSSYDSKDGLGLVSIYENNSNNVAFSDSLGYFRMDLEEGTVHITASYVGYFSIDTSFYLNRDIVLNFYLKPSNYIQEVKVLGQNIDDVVNSPQGGTIHVNPEVISRLPSLAGEVDVIKALQYLPGVQGGKEGGSGMTVRGGSFDQNLIVIDGVPMYNISHLGDFFSVFNNDAIKDITLMKGGFSARYGGRLSSVIDVKMKTGNMDSLQGTIGVGMLSSRIMLEGPIKKGHSSFVVSARRSYPDLILGPIKKWGERDGGNGRLNTWKLHFGDAYAKMSFRLNKKNDIDVFGFVNSDIYQEGYTNGDEDEYVSDLFGNKVKNIVGSIEWTNSPRKEIQFQTSASFVGYGNQILSNIVENGSVTAEENFDTFINDWRMKSQVTMQRNNKTIRLGLEGVSHQYLPGRFSLLNDTVLSSGLLGATEGIGYVEDDWTLGNLRMNLGFRLSYFKGEESFLSPQPRIALRYKINDLWSVKASYSEMVQYVTEKSIDGLVNIWSLGSGERFGPQKSKQVSMGTAMMKKGYEFSIDGYYKRMDDVLDHKSSSAFFYNLQDWQELIVQGKGESYGAELFINKKEGDFSGTLGYTLSWNWRQFDAINNGERYPYHFDRRHELKLVMNYERSKRVSFSGIWVFGTGNAITLPIGVGRVWARGVEYSHKYYKYFTEPIYIYSKKNALREPAYHRLDLSVRLRKDKKRGERIWGFGLYNVYARANPFFLYVDEVYRKDVDGNDTFDHRAIFRKSFFTLLPSISYTFKIK